MHENTLIKKVSQTKDQEESQLKATRLETLEIGRSKNR